MNFEHVQRQVAEIVLEHSGELDPSEATLVLDLLQTQSNASSPQCRAFDCVSSTVGDVTGTSATDVEVFFHEHSTVFWDNATKEQGPNLRDLDGELLALLQEQGLHDIVTNNSLGFWVSVRTAEGDSVNVALGYSAAPQFVDPNSTVPPTAALPTDIVPAGSLTKSFVAAAVMRLVEAGELGINDTAAPLANQVQNPATCHRSAVQVSLVSLASLLPEACGTYCFCPGTSKLGYERHFGTALRPSTRQCNAAGAVVNVDWNFGVL